MAARSLAAILLGSAVLLASGCGHTHVPRALSPSAKRIKLESQDLEIVVAGLGLAVPSTERAVAAAKKVWPLIYAGLPTRISTRRQRQIAQAAKLAGEVYLPPLFEEDAAAALTGPGANLASILRGFKYLDERSWEQIEYAATLQVTGPVSHARFARENVNLYIEGVYDAHFELSQIGKQLERGYTDLGGPTEFLGKLTDEKVDRLAEIYSEPNVRLYPHVVAKLGS